MRFWLMFMVSFLARVCFAQLYPEPVVHTNITISGKIQDAQTGESLPFATISVKGTAIGSSSNVDGFFTLLKLPTDTSTLLVSYIGHESREVKLSPETSLQILIIELYPYSKQLSEVVVTAERESVLKTNETISVIKMSPQSLSKLPNIGERDIMRSFQLMPGVSASNESSSGLYVRGGTPDQNLILYDGFTIYHVDHLYGFFSAFNANALKDVQLYKGGFESRFGGRLSSVMEVTGKDGNAKNYNVGGDLSLLSMNIFAEAPIGDKFTSIVAFRKSWKGPLYNKIFKQFNDGTEPLPGQANFAIKANSYFYDLNGKFTYKPTQRDVISLSIFNGTDVIENTQSLVTPVFFATRGIDININISDLTNYGNVGSSLKWARQWNKKVYVNSLLSFSNYYSERDRNSRVRIKIGDVEQNFRGGISEDNDLKDFSVKSDVIYDHSANQQWLFGFFGTQYDIAYTFIQSDTATILDRGNTGLLTGIYLQNRINLNSYVQVIPGIRISYFEPTKRTYYEPRLSAIYTLTEHLKLSGAFGRYYQFANRITREDILAGSRDFWILSDGKSVPVSSSDHFIGAISYETKNNLLTVEAYRKNFSGISEYSLRFGRNNQNINYNENFYTGTGYAQGIEFLLQRKIGKFTGWVSYTHMEAHNKFSIYGEQAFSSGQDITHEFKVVNMLSLGHWNVSATWIYATGRPYTAPDGGYQITLLDGTVQDFISIGPKNTNRLPDYHRLDIAATYELRNEKGEPIGNIGASIFNVYNRENVWYKEYQIVEGEVLESDIRYLGITPNLSLSLRIR